eukprot:scaffold89261_cov61-Phaeocystis_antarctica.AAC.3
MVAPPPPSAAAPSKYSHGKYSHSKLVPITVAIPTMYGLPYGAPYWCPTTAITLLWLFLSHYSLERALLVPDHSFNSTYNASFSHTTY